MIYLKLKNKPKNIKELLLELFSNGDSKKRTNVTTYTSENCDIVQCYNGKYRSYDEVSIIINTYFPNTDDKTIIHELLTLDFGLDDPLYLVMTNCSTINKIVLYYSDNFFTNTIFNIQKYHSRVSWDELLLLINLKSKDDIKSYIKKYIKIKEDIIDKIKTWEDVLNCSGKNEDEVLPWKNPVNKQQLSQNALAKIQLIAEVLNEGVILDFSNREQYKYVPYFVKNSDLVGWVCGSCSDFSYLSHDGFGCYFKSSNLAIYAGKQFIDIYRDYLP